MTTNFSAMGTSSFTRGGCPGRRPSNDSFIRRCNNSMGSGGAWPNGPTFCPVSWRFCHSFTSTFPKMKLVGPQISLIFLDPWKTPNKIPINCKKTQHFHLPLHRVLEGLVAGHCRKHHHYRHVLCQCKCTKWPQHLAMSWMGNSRSRLQLLHIHPATKTYI